MRFENCIRENIISEKNRKFWVFALAKLLHIVASGDPVSYGPLFWCIWSFLEIDNPWLSSAFTLYGKEQCTLSANLVLKENTESKCLKFVLFHFEIILQGIKLCYTCFERRKKKK